MIYRFRNQPSFIHNCTHDHARHHHVMSPHQEQRHNLRSQVYRRGTPGLEREMHSILCPETPGNPKVPAVRYID
jgi:hypothetical protein